MKYLLIILIPLVSCTSIHLSITDRQLIFQDNLKSLDNFNVKDREFYNDNDVWFSKEAVALSDSGLIIKCLKDTTKHESWQGKRITSWTSGMIDTKNKVEISKGLWVITAKLNSAWPAIWLLKHERNITGFVKEQIIPEVDIVETIHNKFRHTVHWGYSDAVYRLYESGKNIRTYDNFFHEFAVDCLSNGYDFYIDGIQTLSLRSSDERFVSGDPAYLIINNAATNEDSEETKVVIKSIKVYK